MVLFENENEKKKHLKHWAEYKQRFEGLINRAVDIDPDLAITKKEALANISNFEAFVSQRIKDKIPTFSRMKDPISNFETDENIPTLANGLINLAAEFGFDFIGCNDIGLVFNEKLADEEIQKRTVITSEDKIVARLRRKFVALERAVKTLKNEDIKIPEMMGLLDQNGNLNLSKMANLRQLPLDKRNIILGYGTSKPPKP